MTLQQLREVVLGSDRDVSDPRVFERITVGVLMAWIAMGGDLLGSCVYGPDVLTRASSANRSVLIVAGVATLATLGILAFAYTRMVALFPHGGGGYTAARHIVGDRLALVSGVALVFDAGFNVAVSVVTCVDAAAAALPPAWAAARLPVALGLIGLLTLLNLRGVKESVALLIPIVIAFVASHVVVLGLAIGDRIGALPGVVAPVPSDLQHLAREQGTLGAFGTVLRAYALGGAIYTGLESVSNGVPILRDPKVQSARKTMLLVAGIPAVIIGVILTAFVLYDVRPEADQPMNAILFERVSRLFGDGLASRLAVTIPLASEAALLVMAAQTGFVDGPRILGALATDRFLPRRLGRLNGRLAPAPGILVVSAMALSATAITGGRLEPLIAVFVISVFVTFTISQWAMLRHALRRRIHRVAWRGDAAVHAIGVILCGVILAGSIANWKLGAAVALSLIAAIVALATTIRRRYGAIAAAVEVVREEAALPVVPPHERPPPSSTDEIIAREAPVAVLVLGDKTDLARVALAWVPNMPAGLGGVILAGVSLLDAEAVQGEEHLTRAEHERRHQLEHVAADVRRSGLPVAIELRRGADVIEAAAALVRDLLRGRPAQSIVVGFRSAIQSSAIDPLLKDDLAIRLQARLQRDRIPMMVLSVPLDA
ncbi:MAG: APC family permease [Anaeromyxobacteraceae bacterium]